VSVYQGAVYAATYAAVTAGSTAIVTVTAPDGTTTTPAVVTLASSFAAQVPAAQVGAYLLVWSVSGTITDVLPDQFTVVAPSLSLISFSDLRDQLNISPTDTTSAAKLRRFIQSGSDVVQNITGPITPTPKQIIYPGGSAYVIIPERYVKSITSVQEFWGGTTIYTLTQAQPGIPPLGAFSYFWDPALNKITRISAGFETNFKPGLAAVTVQYIAGMATIPQDISDATGELIRHWWANGQQPWRAAFQPGGDDTGFQPVMGYAIPNRVLEMLLPYKKKPGIF
jgi:hypothetical protein